MTFRHRFRFLVATATLAVACASPPPPNAAMRAKVEAGCSSLEKCLALVAEAGARVRECEYESRPRNCSPEYVDEASAKRLLRPFEEAAAERVRRAKAERELEEARRTSAYLAARLEERRRAEEEERARREALAAERERAAYAREVRGRTYSELGPEGRGAYLKACHRNGLEVLAPEILEAEGPSAVPLTCDRLLPELLAVSASRAEGDALLTIAERHVDGYGHSFRVHPEAAPSHSRGASSARGSPREPASGDRSLLCCDGTTSPSCTCGGSHRGCCSRHKGVCGCAE